MPHGVLRPQTKEELHNDLGTEQLETLQHFIELGRLSASILHEISSPLTAALLYLDQVNPDDATSLLQARRSLGALRNYVEAARQQVRHQSQQPLSFCMHPQMRQVKRLVVPLARVARVKLVFEASPHYKLSGDPVKFQQVMANLIINAIDAYADAGDALKQPIKISVSGSSKHVIITVVDWGEGIQPDQLSRVFEPFYTTKGGTQHGLGIGLTIVKEHITRDFGGSIRVSSSRRYGTRFVIKLPATAYSASHFRKKH